MDRWEGLNSKGSLVGGVTVKTSEAMRRGEENEAGG